MELYRLKNADVAILNKLSDVGWKLIVDSEELLARGFPILVGIEFDVPLDSSAMDDIAVRWLEKAANQSQKNVRTLKKYGFRFVRYYSDDAGKHLYRVEKKGKAITEWRFEFNWSEDPCYGYVTFGNPMLQTPALVNAEVIESVVPKETLEAALATGAVEKVEVPDEEIRFGNNEGEGGK